MGRGEGEEKGGGSCDHLLLLLSEDLLIQILLCLPVISLLRFKSVCKSWRAIIENPFFINLHLATTEDSGSSCIIFLEYLEKEAQICKLSGEKFEVFEYLDRPPLLDLGEKIELVKEWNSFLVAGCLNGIICLHDFLTRNFALWNPAIKQSRLLPKPSNLLGNPNSLFGTNAADFVRFGIDIKTNDYKLLLITSFKPCGRRSDLISEPRKTRRRVHVYSLSTDSWKCIDKAILSAAHPDPDIHISEFEYPGLYLNGSYFFTVGYKYKDIKGQIWGMPLLLSFDFTEEIFRTIQLPFDLSNNIINSVSSYFISFGKKIALIVDKKEEFDEYKYYDIWVLNEQHSLKESWTKFYTIGSPTNIILQAITNNGEFAIIFDIYEEKFCCEGKDDPLENNRAKLELLNLITGEKKILRCGCELLWMDIYVYKPSLVPTGATHNSRLLEFDATP